MVNGNMKNFSALLGSREVQTGTAVHCNSTAVRDVLANVKKKNDECWRGSREGISVFHPLFSSPLPYISL